MEEWKEYKLGDLCTELSDGLHKAPKFVNGGDYIFVNAKNISNGFVVDNDPTKKSDYEEYLKYSSPLNETTVLYSIDGTIGNIALYRGEKCILGKGACYMNPNPALLDRMYLYYELQAPHFKLYIDKMSTGSTIKHISLKTMRNYEMKVPSIKTQQQLVSILKSLDDKIEVNRRINENLEQQAQALFKSWFVDFEPFKADELVESELGMIPKGWRVYSLSEFLPVITGKKDANVAKGGVYPFFSCSQDYSWTDEYSFDGSAILVAGNGDFNVKMYVGKFEAYQRTYVLIPYNPSYTAWLYYAVKYHLKEITSAARGSVIKFITKGNLADFKFAAPSSLDGVDIITKFDKIRKKVSAGIEESRRLAELRDTLLPKLMSGELNVENVTF